MINVLIVEDDPMVAELNKRYLEKIEGYYLVALASSVEQGLSIIKQQDIDLILLDIYMPKNPGWKLASEIRRLGKSIDIIVISAACDIESIKKGVRFGAVDYIIKPFDFERFKSALAAYKESHRFMVKNQQASQLDIDLKIFNKGVKQSKLLELPKGLTRNTLQYVWEDILTFNNTCFSTEQLAKKTGISRVSMRKYLQFLNQIGVIDTKITYGSIGRPVYKHRLLPEGENIVQVYLKS